MLSYSCTFLVLFCHPLTTFILQSCCALILLCFSCPILSSSYTTILQSCPPLILLCISCYPVILLHVHSPILSSSHTPVLFLSYPVILLHIHFQILSSSHPLHYCCHILSSFHTFILLSCHLITSAFFNPVILSSFSSPIRSFSYKFILGNSYL
jgi:hypothetical protein